jgi:hypothetical protein
MTHFLGRSLTRLKSANQASGRCGHRVQAYEMRFGKIKGTMSFRTRMQLLLLQHLCWQDMRVINKKIQSIGKQPFMVTV